MPPCDLIDSIRECWCGEAGCSPSWSKYTPAATLFWIVDFGRYLRPTFESFGSLRSTWTIWILTSSATDTTGGLTFASVSVFAAGGGGGLPVQFRWRQLGLSLQRSQLGK